MRRMKKMNYYKTVAAIAAAGVLSIACAQVGAAVIPVSGGTANSSSFEKFAEFFDAQPLTTPTAGATADNFGTAGAIYTNSGRAAYVDFGANFNLVTINGVWLGLKLNGTNPSDANDSLLTFWSSDKDKAFEAGEGDTLAPDFNMFTWTGATPSKSWQQIFTGSVTPAQRYWVIAFDGTQVASNRIEEIVFTSVPEPASFSLLGLAGLMLLRRRPEVV